jgi:hypothetical protein
LYDGKFWDHRENGGKAVTLIRRSGRAMILALDSSGMF